MDPPFNSIHVGIQLIKCVEMKFSTTNPNYKGHIWAALGNSLHGGFTELDLS